MRIAFIGLGEAATAIISGWAGTSAQEIRAYDIKSDDPGTAPEIAARAHDLGVINCASLADAIANADLVFSTVTADQAVTVARSAAPHVTANAAWCDLNSCAPASKQQAASLIAGAGARYLDVAVMAPVYPKRNLVPTLISGPDATDLANLLAALPMNVRAVGDAVGRASSIKMIRSIMVKGMEALTAECTLAAVAAGVEDEVFPSLKSGHPKIDVVERATYNFDRSLVHGHRRAVEMDEVAKMLLDMGLLNDMSAAAAKWQRAIAETGVAASEGGDPPDYAWYAAELLKRLT